MLMIMFSMIVSLLLTNALPKDEQAKITVKLMKKLEKEFNDVKWYDHSGTYFVVSLKCLGTKQQFLLGDDGKQEVRCGFQGQECQFNVWETHPDGRQVHRCPGQGYEMTILEKNCKEVEELEFNHEFGFRHEKVLKRHCLEDDPKNEIRVSLKNLQK